jgi:hypothetical protein
MAQTSNKVERRIAVEQWLVTGRWRRSLFDGGGSQT